MREAPQPACAPSTNYDDCYKSSGSDTYIEHCYHAIPRKLGFGMEKDHVDCIPDRDAAHHIFARVGHCGYLDLSDEMICQFIDCTSSSYEKLLTGAVCLDTTDHYKDIWPRRNRKELFIISLRKNRDFLVQDHHLHLRKSP